MLGEAVYANGYTVQSCKWIVWKISVMDGSSHGIQNDNHVNCFFFAENSLFYNSENVFMAVFLNL